MRYIISLLAVLSILAPAGIAAAHHDSQNKRKYSNQNNNNNQRRSSSRNQFDSSTQAEKDQRAYIDPAYGDYPAWAGIAFSPQGRNR